MSVPLVSVVIATYNRATMLMEAVTSVLGQTFSDYEILVADDGSSSDMTGRLASLSGPIRYLRVSHSGRPSVTRNRAVTVARGRLLAFLDDDDLWEPRKLERQVDSLTRDPSLGLVYSDVRLLSPDGTISEPVLKRHEKRRGAIFGPLLSGCFIHPSTVLTRRTLVERVGGFDENLTTIEDYDLWLRLAAVAPAEYCDEPLALIRRHDSELSVRKENDTWHNVLTVMGRVREEHDLGFRDRLRVRRLLARAHTRLGLLSEREGPAPRAHFLRALRLNPLQRQAWRHLALLGRRRPRP